MLVIGGIVMSLGFIVYYGLQTQYALLLRTELHVSPKATMAFVMLFNAGMLVGVIAAGIVAARRGVIFALVVPALLMVPALPLYVGWIPGNPALVVGAVLGGVLGVGYSGVTPVLTTSLFPEHVRARAIGLVYHVGAFVAAFVPSLIPQLTSWTGWSLSTAIVVVVGGGLVAMSAVILVRAPRHRAGRGHAHADRAHRCRRDHGARCARRGDAALADAPAARELHPVATAIVDREVAKAAERRAILRLIGIRRVRDRGRRARLRSPTISTMPPSRSSAASSSAGDMHARKIFASCLRVAMRAPSR